MFAQNKKDEKLLNRFLISVNTKRYKDAMYESEGAEIESVVRSVLLDASVKVNDLQDKE